MIDNDEKLVGSNAEYDFYTSNWTKSYEKTLSKFNQHGRSVENFRVLEVRKKGTDNRVAYVVQDTRTGEQLFSFKNFEDIEWMKELYLMKLEDQDDIIQMAKERNGSAQKEREFQARVKAEYDRRMAIYEKERAEREKNRKGHEPDLDGIFHRTPKGMPIYREVYQEMLAKEKGE